MFDWLIFSVEKINQSGVTKQFILQSDFMQMLP